MPIINLNGNNLVVRLYVDDYKIVVKQPQFPLHTTGNTYWNFVGSGCTVIVENHHGNIVDVTIYNPCNTGLTQAQFNSYTGATEIRLQGIEGDIIYLSGQTAGKLNTSTFNSYTGVTAILIGTKLDKSTFNTFTGTTLPNSYYNKTQINSYTGATDIKINTKLNTSTFSTYTGTTAPNQFAAKIHAHSYTGATITDKPSFVGAGGTTVNLLNNTYTISSAVPTGMTTTWGNIVGTLSGQTDLQLALNGKAPTVHSHPQYATVVALTGHTSNSSIHRTSGQTQSQITGYAAPIVHTHPQYLTGFTVTCDMVTGCTDSLYLHNDALNGYWNSGQTSQAISAATSGLTADWNSLSNRPQWLTGTTLNDFETGHTHGQYLTGFTVTCDMVTGCTDSLYLHNDALNGYWNSGQTTGFTNNAYSLKNHLHTGVYSPTAHTHTTLYAPLGKFQSHTGDTTIHFTQGSINISESQVTNLTTDLQNRSLTGHSHSYTGSTITNKPTFTGSGATIVQLHGNDYRIYSPTDVDSYVPLTTYQTYTGTTAPNAFASKSFLSTYTGTTVPNTYQTKTLAITGSTSMGGTTQVGVNSGNKVQVKGLAASGLVSITTGATYNTIVGNADSSKLNTSTFSTYTGTTAPTTFLKLNQNPHQHVTGGLPSFDEGIQFGIVTSILTGSTQGRMYYSDIYKTLMVDASTNMTIPIGEKEVRWVWNGTGAILSKGKAVYDAGNHVGTPNTISVALAKANTELTSEIVGIVSEDIPIGAYGFITTGGIINNLDTLSNEYSGMTAGDTLYLSEAIAGNVTNVIPLQPNYSVKVGRLSFKDTTTGTIYVDAKRLPLIRNLADTYIAPIIATDDVLKWNGLNWTNGSPASASASAGISFFLDDTNILSGGTQNVNEVVTLSRAPITTTEVVDTITLNSNTVLAETYLYDVLMNRIQIDAGVWNFYTYLAVNNAGGTNTLTHRINKVVEGTGTITITGTSTTRTVIASTGTPFASANVNVGGTLITDSFLQTTKGLYRMLSRVSDTRITISTPTTYVNETTVAYKVHKRLFDVTTPDISNTATSPLFAGLALNTMTVAQPAFPINATDKISDMVLGTSSTNGRAVYFSHNGTTRYSYLNSPLVTRHNQLAVVQGMVGDEAYHITAAQAVVMGNTSNTNSGDETKASIESKLTGDISSHTHNTLYQTKALTITGSTSLGGTTQVGANSGNKVGIKGLSGGTNITITTGTTRNTIVAIADSTKANLASPTFTGVVTIPTPFTLGAISVKTTGTELNYVTGTTSNIQTQLGLKAPLANAVFTGTHATTGGIIDLNVSSNYAVNIANNTSTGTVGIGDGTGIQAINIGSGNAVKTISIGSHDTPANVIGIGGNASTTTFKGIHNINNSLNYATNINYGTSTGKISLGGEGIQTIAVGESTGVKTINIGNHATPANVISIGGTNTVTTVGGQLINNPIIKLTTGTTYTCLAADNGKILEFSSGSATAITLPTGLTTGWNASIVNYGAGVKTLTAGTGVTIRSKSSYVKLSTIYDACSVYYRGSGIWVAFGDLTTS